MIFTTLSFTIFFLVFIIIWWSIPKKNINTRKAFLVLSSYIFYSFTGLQWLLTLFATSVFTYLMSQWINKTKNKKAVGIFSCFVLICQLVFWKYVPWAVLTWNEFSFVDQNMYIEPPEFLFPVGLSFFTFHALSLIIPVWCENKKPYSLIETLAHISFFPALLAGPVLKYDDINSRWNKSWDWKEVDWTQGVLRIFLGMTFKWVFASKCAEYTSLAFDGVNDNAWQVILGVHAYTLQIFFDFAGYSHMAIGLAILMGWKLPENFTQPYLSISIQDFWRNWHRSLSFFFRDNLYIHALGGNRKGYCNSLWNAFFTMLVSGLWHGANLTFILWGAFHGCLLFIQNIFKKYSGIKIPVFLSWFITFESVVLGWVLFKAENVDHAVEIYKEIFNIKSLLSFNIDFSFEVLSWFLLMIIFICCEKIILSIFVKLNTYYEGVFHIDKIRNGICFTIILAFWSYLIIHYGPIGVPDFIYNGF